MRTMFLALALAMAAATPAHPRTNSPNCPPDLNGDGVVDSDDLAVMLAGWGQPGLTDLDGNGLTDGADLGPLLLAWGPCPKPSPTTFVGVVVLGNGSPLAGAVVVSNLGGAVTTGEDGEYELEVDISKPVGTVTLTAIATIDGTTHQGSRVVESVTLDGLNQVDPIYPVPTYDGCESEFDWMPGFELPGLRKVQSATASGTALALEAFDDGHGISLYAGGSFDIAGNALATNIARWDGTSWSALGAGVGDSQSAVHALTVFDDGSGAALYVGGTFALAGGRTVGSIARWDGKAWSELGQGVDGSVNALAVFDDGAGPALYVGGAFTGAGDVPANNVARWDGQAWRALGGGVNADVRALAVFDDGSGAALYVGGTFALAGGRTVSSIARWDGKAWSELGQGVDGSVNALAVFDDGAGPALYVGGAFTGAGDVPANNVARWDGQAWRALGDGVNAGVNALTVCDATSEPTLCAGGWFTAAGGQDANYIAKWNGTVWSNLGSGLVKPTNALLWFGSKESDGALCAGIDSESGYAINQWGIARWDGVVWRSIGADNGVNGRVLALAVFDDGAGPALYAGGTFSSAGGLAANNIARWDGHSWSELGAGTGGTVNSLAVFDDGTGPALYAGGSFLIAGDVAAGNIARWDGTSWTALGSGVGPGLRAVRALAVFDDGTGGALYAGGSFVNAEDVIVNNIAQWDGNSWSALGMGLGGSVKALAVFNNGTSAALYAGGSFSSAGGEYAKNIARWDGVSWSAVGGGVSQSVRALAVFDDGLGPELYVAGGFTSAGGVEVRNIARWDGEDWSAIGNGLGFLPSTMAVFDDGSGAALYVGGSPSGPARWDGQLWSELNNASWPVTVSALEVFDGDRSGPAIFAGGLIGVAGGLPSGNIAKWGCLTPSR